jgi:hypothetical protein
VSLVSLVARLGYGFDSGRIFARISPSSGIKYLYFGLVPVFFIAKRHKLLYNCDCVPRIK